jgi:hypothetical protein
MASLRAQILDQVGADDLTNSPYKRRSAYEREHPSTCRDTVTRSPALPCSALSLWSPG